MLLSFLEKVLISEMRGLNIKRIKRNLPLKKNLQEFRSKGSIKETKIVSTARRFRYFEVRWRVNYVFVFFCTNGSKALILHQDLLGLKLSHCEGNFRLIITITKYYGWIIYTFYTSTYTHIYFPIKIVVFKTFCSCFHSNKCLNITSTYNNCKFFNRPINIFSLINKSSDIFFINNYFYSSGLIFFFIWDKM